MASRFVRQCATALHAVCSRTRPAWGSTPHAHALAKVKRPQDQGEIAIVSVFIDTFVVLTLTAMVILTSGMLNPGAPDGLQGTELAQAAFKASLGSAGMAFVAICMLFFAFSTIIGWYFFGEQNVKAMFGHKAVKVYAAIVVICIVIGSALHVDWYGTCPTCSTA